MDATDAVGPTTAEPPPPGHYEWLTFNSPLSNDRADRLAAGLAAARPRRVLDLGCGWGELLLRTVAAAPDSTGTGVDTDSRCLARARATAATRGLDGRVRFVDGKADEVPAEPADVVVCVGASHAFGDTAAALRSLRRFVRPGGQLLFGEAFWERTPTAEQAAGLGEGSTPDDFTDLPGLVDLAVQAGFRPLRIESANRDEWEEFESGYLRDWESWLVRFGDRPEAAGIRTRAEEHRTGWLRGYRDVLGFAYLTLGRPARDGTD